MANGVIVIDKPADWTSMDVCAKLRGILHERRVGHAGTLDPMATGVLPVFVGRATRAVEFAGGAEKEYIAGLKLGVITNTQDTTGEVLERRSVSCGRAGVEAVLPRFTGEIEQIPPMYSAVSVGGVRLYKLARQGVEIEREPRRVTVDSLTLGETVGENEYELLVGCSKGLYVRTLIADIGEALGCGAAMSGLRRLRAGVFSIEDAITLEQAAELAQTGRLAASARSADILFSGLPELRLTARGETVIRHGALWRTTLPDGGCRLYGPDGTFLGLGAVEGGQVRIQKSFY